MQTQPVWLRSAQAVLLPFHLQLARPAMQTQSVRLPLHGMQQGFDAPYTDLSESLLVKCASHVHARCPWAETGLC